MKKTIMLLLAVATFSFSFAQNDAIGTYFAKYENDTAFTKVTISAKMFSLFTHIDGETPEEKELLKTISRLNGMRILVNDNASNGKALYQQAIKTKMSGFEELMTVQDKDEDLKFYIREQSGIVRELLLVGGGTHEFFVLSLTGDIDLRQLSKLSKAMDIDGLEKLENLEKKK